MYNSFSENQLKISAIAEHEALSVTSYLKLMYEYIGFDPPVDMDCYLVTKQKTRVYFNSFLTSLLTAIEEKSRGDHPCKVM